MQTWPKSLLTEGIRISVETQFLPEQSSRALDKYVFAYRITIENESASDVQLLRRRWEIVDGLGERRVVAGEGVVGFQPKLTPGESHSYSSGCYFRTPIGKMSGYYTMARLHDGARFFVEIPAFILQATHLQN